MIFSETGEDVFTYTCESSTNNQSTMQKYILVQSAWQRFPNLDHAKFTVCDFKCTASCSATQPQPTLGFLSNPVLLHGKLDLAGGNLEQVMMVKVEVIPRLGKKSR